MREWDEIISELFSKRHRQGSGEEGLFSRLMKTEFNEVILFGK